MPRNVGISAYLTIRNFHNNQISCSPNIVIVKLTSTQGNILKKYTEMKKKSYETVPPAISQLPNGQEPQDPQLEDHALRLQEKRNALILHWVRLLKPANGWPLKMKTKTKALT